MSFYVIDNYDSFTFNLVQQVRQLTTKKVEVVHNDEISLAGLVARKPAGIIISPGPGHPGVRKDFGINRQIIQERSLLGCPILGICLGHQGIAHTLGGTIGHSKPIMHGKASNVELLATSPIFCDLPPVIRAMRYHSLEVIEHCLPSPLMVTARDLASGSIMAIEHRSEPLFGIQFHPESIGTPEGSQIMRNFLQLC